MNYLNILAVCSIDNNGKKPGLSPSAYGLDPVFADCTLSPAENFERSQE
jgi:hypothetical protein